MQRFYRLFAAALTAAVLFPGCSTPTTAEEFASGGSAAQPAIAAYESWMQFASPDTHTPAIDTDGCLNYALAKMSVRYHLPVSGVDLLSDSYTYYTAFTNQAPFRQRHQNGSGSRCLFGIPDPRRNCLAVRQHGRTHGTGIHSLCRK